MVSASGISRGRYESCQYDRYIGTQETLISEGLASPEWFPQGPEPRRRGRKPTTKRTYEIVTDRSRLLRPESGMKKMLHVELYDLRNGKWELRIPVPVEEQRRRDHAQREKWEEIERRETCQREASEEQEFKHGLEAAFRQLAPFESGSMSEGEKYFIRIARGLGGREWDTLVGFAERMLARSHPAVPRVLRLVVDNTGS